MNIKSIVRIQNEDGSFHCYGTIIKRRDDSVIANAYDWLVLWDNGEISWQSHYDLIEVQVP